MRIGRHFLSFGYFLKLIPLNSIIHLKKIMAATQIRKENARMDRAELLQIISLGKDSKNQFKEKINSSYTLAAEIGAFANSQGGRIIVAGVMRAAGFLKHLSI